MPHPQAAAIYVLRSAIVGALPETGQRRLLEALAAQVSGSIAVPVAVVGLEGALWPRQQGLGLRRRRSSFPHPEPPPAGG